MNDLQKPASAGPAEPYLPPPLRKPNLRRDEASQYLEAVYGIIQAPATLAKKACLGGGPPYFKANATPLYPKSGLDAWARELLGNLRANTSVEG